jgi:hypothetical protein
VAGAIRSSRPRYQETWRTGLLLIGLGTFGAEVSRATVDASPGLERHYERSGGAAPGHLFENGSERYGSGRVQLERQMCNPLCLGAHDEWQS